MRYPAAEKLEIIRLVEQSALPVRRTLEKIGIPRATFYLWYDLYRTGKMVAPYGIDLHVNKDNLRAIRFYEKHGFFVGGEDFNPNSQSPIFMMCWRPNSLVDAAYW